MKNGREDDKMIIDAAKALNKPKFTTLDVYYAINDGRRIRKYASRNESRITPQGIRQALERNGARIVERGARTARPLYSFFEDDKL